MEIDNNLVENAIRPTAIGKKNWLFIPSAALRASAATPPRATAEPSSTASWKALRQAQGLCGCRRRGLDPYRYLSEVLTALPTLTNWQVKDWTPEAWAKSQRPARKAA